MGPRLYRSRKLEDTCAERQERHLKDRNGVPLQWPPPCCDGRMARSYEDEEAMRVMMGGMEGARDEY